MCGFVGFSDQRPPKEKKAVLQRMMQRIVHRGPDMAGDYADAGMGLGFRRLSVIDLSHAGAQPMYNEDKTLVAVANGEIYNFAELRAALEACGHRFASNSDVEVLVHGFEEYGPGIVHKLRGMFAFAVWNTQTRTLFAARDPFGIKPFYYAPLPEGGLLFASEIKCFLEHPGFEKAVNPGALRAYLTFQYAAGNDTFFRGVRALPPGHHFTWAEGEVHPEPYWDATFTPDEGPGMDEWVQRIDDAVHESVNAHRVSDVKLGSFLSGGVDSSYITACLMPEETFSVGFAQQKFDETTYAAELSAKLGIRNHRRELTARECFDAFPAIQYHMDQPQANPSSVPLWFLAQLAREHVAVVLSGEGADELFAGYDLYLDTPPMQNYKKLPQGLRRALGGAAGALPNFKGRNFLMKSAGRPASWFVGQASVFPEGEALSILKAPYRGGPAPRDLTAPHFAKVQHLAEVSQKQYVDIHLWMPGDILLKADRMCMAHSLELRVPFLDRNIMQLAGQVPVRYLVQGMEGKVAMRRAANRTLPSEWANRTKKGFPVPIRYWLREKPWYELVRSQFAASYAAEFFEQDKILRLLEDHYAQRANNARKIWVVYTFLVWYERFFVQETGGAA